LQLHGAIVEDNAGAEACEGSERTQKEYKWRLAASPGKFRSADLLFTNYLLLAHLY
jgi:hypothetical protein